MTDKKPKQCLVWQQDRLRLVEGWCLGIDEFSIIGEVGFDFFHQGRASLTQSADGALQVLNHLWVLFVAWLCQVVGQQPAHGADLLQRVLFPTHQLGQCRVLRRGPGAALVKRTLNSPTTGQIGKFEGLRQMRLGERRAGSFGVQISQQANISFQNQGQSGLAYCSQSVVITGPARATEQDGHRLLETKQRLLMFTRSIFHDG